MQHTYLRYECADSFGLAASSGSSKAPNSNSILAFLGNSSTNSPVLTVAGSYCMGFNLRTCLPCLKLGHREHLTGGLGTGRALNSDELVCLDVAFARVDDATTKVATGWVDGAIRIFDIYPDEITKPLGLAHSLIHTNEDDDDFVLREPLSLNGHNQSPVRTISFDERNASRLASGGSDGSVVLWDVIAETGLFRLLGHKGGVTNVIFCRIQKEMDALITASLDGLVKIWDLEGQCCTQTVATHRGEVWAAACMRIRPDEETDENNINNDSRWRLVTGSIDGLVRVWSVQAPQRTAQIITNEDKGTTSDNSHNNDKGNTMDDTCHYMGCLLPPPNVLTSAEKISSVKYHPNGRHVGVLRANGRNVDVYIIRTARESLRKKQRRLRRRQEKAKKKETNEPSAKKGPKRGILDDPESSDDDDNDNSADAMKQEESLLSPELVKASDEFEYFGTVRASHKVRGFAFVPSTAHKNKGGIRLVCALSTNALETHSLSWKKEGDERPATATANKISTMDMYGHPTGVRAVALSSDDVYACTVSKNVTKVWNVATRSCIQSLSIPNNKTKNNKSSSTLFGLCAIFLPGNTHVVMGTREGCLLIIDIAAGDVIFSDESAHEGAIWSIDLRRPSSSVNDTSTVVVVTGSADKTVKMWDIESQEEENSDEDNKEERGRMSNTANAPMLVHTRTLQMTDEVVAVRYSHTTDATKRFVFVSALDCTVKVFFEDSLKLFLSLYGHKLPALAVDASDDDTLLASAGADKTIKIWGLDFGDTHRTLHGHEDSVTDLRFVRRTHNFFTASKDGTIRYWDGDRFEQILLLQGHFAEVCCLALGQTGATVLSGGMDRQVRVWERTKDIVFLEEERERELEQMFDKVDNRDEGGTAQILRSKNRGGDLDDDDDNNDDNDHANEQPQSEAAVKKSVMSVASGDRIMEALELADQELKDIATFRKSQQGKSQKQERSPNPLLLNMDPAPYVLWILQSIKPSELEQSLLVLPLTHVERLMYYLVILLRSGRGIELSSRVAVFIIQTHQNQLIMNQSLTIPLREMRDLIRLRLGEVRDTVGYNLAALKMIARVGKERKQSFPDPADDAQMGSMIWAGLGKGSDAAAEIQGRRR